MRGEDLQPFFRSLRRNLPGIGSLRAYGLALGFLALAVLLRVPLEPSLNARLPPYLTIYPAVVLSSFAGGIRVGAFAGVLGGLAAWFFWVAPLGSLSFPSGPLFLGAAYVLSMSITVVTCGTSRLLLEHVGALENQRSLQAKETVHRIKNLIAVVHAIGLKVSRHSETPEAFASNFGSRMAALATAQNVLLQADWTDVSVGDLVQSALAPFLPNPALKLVGGPDATVPARFVGGLCMAFYELATNAMKHGALFASPGAVEINWRTETDCLVLTWRETNAGDHTPTSSIQEGFGTRLIQDALGRSEGTRVHYEVDLRGVVAEFSWPAALCGRAAPLSFNPSPPNQKAPV